MKDSGLRVVSDLKDRFESSVTRCLDRRIISRSRLFDEEWYLRRYPDVAKARVDPFRHYVTYGTAERRSPNPYFDAAWYLAENPDVAAAGVNPLVHYLKSGAAEGRNPSPSFDSVWYLTRNPDVLVSGINPLIHFCLFGQLEGREKRAVTDFPDQLSFFFVTQRHFLGFVRPLEQDNEQNSSIDQGIRSVALSELLPTGARFFKPPEGRFVDIVVPVYRGFEESRRCVESVLSSRGLNRSFGHLILIDDCGPEPKLCSYLSEISDHDAVVLLKNDANLGFVASVNRGMSWADPNDVILLNSDTEVCGNWVDRLKVQAYADSRIGTVTPLSNNATICSYPEIGGQATLPTGVTLREIDTACSEANAFRAVGVPTAVGSCMFIRRECLRQVGDFDVDAFGKGYGEETDFCQRAMRFGWRHILAGDVFVFHAGEVSFGAQSSARKATASALMQQRYPDYAASVASWVQRDPALPLRITATAALFRRVGQPVILHIMHSWGGGTEKQVADLASQIEGARHIILAVRRRAVHIGFLLLLPEPSGWRAVEFSAAAMADIAPFLCTFGPTQVHVHNFVNVLDELGGFLRRVSLPYDLSIHDYTAICPRINLFKTESGYCNEPEEPGCLRCLSTGGALADDILWWRHLGLSLVADADRVLCPSVDAERRVRRYASNARTIVVPHEHQLYRSVRTLRLSRLQASEPLRVAVIGVMNAQKGGGFLLDCIEAAVEIGLSVVWSIVGEFTQPLKTRANALGPRLTTTGSYRVNDVHRLIRNVEPHLILFTQRWPETYSFTLSEALQSGYPILAPEIGSFPERLRGLTGCQLYPIETSAHALAEKLMSVRDTYLTSGEPFIDSAVYAAPKQGFIDFDFYQHHYVRT